jgi:hypothetical protein
MPDVDALPGKAVADQSTVRIVAARADHRGRRSGTRCGNGLVRAFASRADDDVGAQDRFAGHGNADHTNPVVGVEAAYDVHVSHGVPRSDR